MMTTPAVRGVPEGTSVSFDRDRMKLYLGDRIVVDLRTLLHDAGALDLVFKQRTETRTVTLARRGGRYLGVTRNASSGAYVAQANGISLSAPSAGEAAVQLALARRNAPSPPQEEEEVTFSHEVTRAERDARGRANAVEVD